MIDVGLCQRYMGASLSSETIGQQTESLSCFAFICHIYIFMFMCPRHISAAFQICNFHKYTDICECVGWKYVYIHIASLFLVMHWIRMWWILCAVLCMRAAHNTMQPYAGPIRCVYSSCENPQSRINHPKSTHKSTLVSLDGIFLVHQPSVCSAPHIRDHMKP